MKKIYLLGSLLFLFLVKTTAQNFWTGLANDHLWSSPANWSSGVPLATHDVIIDNSFEAGSFTVIMPNSQVNVTSITITPNLGNDITLELPSLNALSPSLTLGGNADVLIINNGGIFKNSSGVPANTASINILNAVATIRINNGGKFIHNNIGLDTYVSHLSTAAGTETGIFEFDMPIIAPPDITVSNSNFGTLILSAVAAGGSKTYTGAGSSNLTIRGDFIINSGVGFFLTMTGDIYLTGDLAINGNFNFSPQTVGVTNRSIVLNNFTTVGQTISGAGNFTLGPNFRQLRVLTGAKVVLQRDIQLPNSNNQFNISTDGTLYTGTSIISGIGEFVISTQGAHLGVGSPDGITAAPALLGNIQTDTRTYFDNVSTFEYNGSTAQVIGNGISTVENLIINNTAYATVTATQPLTITNQLSLQKGFLTTGIGTTPTLNATATIVSPFSNHAAIPNIGWEKSFVNGPITTLISATGARWMPIGTIDGTDTIFAPMAINKFNNALATYTTEYFYSPHYDVNNVENPLDHVSKIEFWSIICAAGNQIDKAARLTLTWRPSSKVGNGNQLDDQQALSDLTIAHHFDNGNGLKWRLEDPNATFSYGGTDPGGYGTISTDQLVTSFSPFTLGTLSSLNILPVRFLEFNGKEDGNNINLQWNTKEETAILYYDIEKSVDGASFEKIGTVEAKNGLISNVYNFIDNNPVNGSNYYRLKIIEAQNENTYGKTIRVAFGKNNPIQIYPNPVTTQLKINLPLSNNVYTINIINSAGEVVKKFYSNNQNNTIDTYRWSPGIYYIKIYNSQQIFTQKIVKQ